MLTNSCLVLNTLQGLKQYMAITTQPKENCLLYASFFFFFFFSEIAELLLKAGSDVNDQSGEHCYGVTPLHDAAENGHLDVVKLLLKYGASLNLRDSRVSQGLTSLNH